MITAENDFIKRFYIMVLIYLNCLTDFFFLRGKREKHTNIQWSGAVTLMKLCRCQLTAFGK